DKARARRNGNRGHVNFFALKGGGFFHTARLDVGGSGALKQPSVTKPVAFGKICNILMLDATEPSEFGLVDAVLLREQGDAGTECGFPCTALFEGFRCYAALLPASWMGFQEFDVIGNR